MRAQSRIKKAIRWAWVASLLLLPACFGDFTLRSPLSQTEVNGGGPNPSTGSTYNVKVSWNANRESAVNATGGGYVIYYGKSQGFVPSTASSVVVPYVSGATAPTSGEITNLPAGTYYVEVVAFSKLNSPSKSNGGSNSSPSSAFQITVP